MTNSEKNRAIATVLGWDDIRELPDGKLIGTAPIDSMMDARQEGIPIPEHASDLNAMHAAEKTLTDEQAQRYFDTLNAMEPKDAHPIDDFVIHATAKQRATAFIAVTGGKK